MQHILDRLRAYGEFLIIVFGEKLLLDDSVPVEAWPVCDALIAFHSKGYPLDKVIKYVELRKPFCVNDIKNQTIFLDRRRVDETLEQNGIPTPRHLYAMRCAHRLANLVC